MKKIVLVIYFAFVGFISFCQDKQIDSMKYLLTTAHADTTKIKAAIYLSSAFASSNIDSSIRYGKLAEQWARVSNNEPLILQSLNTLSGALSERDIPASMQAGFAALQLAEKLNDKPAMVDAYTSIGILQIYLGNAQLYVENLKKAVALCAKGNPRIFNLYQEIGGAYIGLNADSAIYYLRMADADSIIRNSAYASYYWGRVLTTSNPQKALGYFKKSLSISNNEHDLRGYSLATRWFSIFYKTHGQTDSAIVVARNGLNAAIQLNFLRGIMYNSEQLTLGYNSLNNTDSAYKYLQVMDAARDSLFNQEKINQIQNAIIREQQRAKKLEDEKIEIQNKTRLFAILAFTFILLLAAIFFYRNQQRVQKSNGILQRQRDELNKKSSELQQSLDNLKSTQAQLSQSEKMASLGELTAGIAHEIQNPLNFVNNFSEVNKELLAEMNIEMEKGNYDEVKEIAKDVSENEEKINHHGKRADAIVKGMLQHSRSSSGIKEPTDINKLADEYLRLSYHGLRAKDKSFNATMKTDYDETIGNINIIPQDIGRVILNLITNAFYAVDEKKKQGIDNLPTGQAGYEPTISLSTKKLNDKVQIIVSDNGNGIPESIKEKIFQPFFTTKPTGQGTGLGLSLAYDIVKTQGGELKVETKDREGLPAGQAGSTFTIQIPIN